MAHFAKVNNGIVEKIIVAEEDFFDEYTDSSPGKWIQCSYNSKGGVHYDLNTGKPSGREHLRYNFPGIGWIYDAEADAFYASQPYPSWTLNTDTYVWEPPVPFPNTDGEFIDYDWNEETQQWEEIARG